MPINLPPDTPPEVREWEERLQREVEETTQRNLNGIDLDELYRLFVAYVNDINTMFGRSLPIASREVFEERARFYASDTNSFAKKVDNLRKGFPGVIAVDEGDPKHEGSIEGVQDARELYRQYVLYTVDMEEANFVREGAPPLPSHALFLSDYREFVRRFTKLGPEITQSHIRNYQRGFAATLEEGIQQVREVLWRKLKDRLVPH